MIRKAIIVLLTFGAIGAGFLWALSYWKPLGSESTTGEHSITVYVTNGQFMAEKKNTLLRRCVPIAWRTSWYYQDHGTLGMALRFPLSPFLILFSLYPAIAFVRGLLRRWQRRGRGLSIRCGYILEGNVSGVCPECGEAK